MTAPAPNVIMFNFTNKKIRIFGERDDYCFFTLGHTQSPVKIKCKKKNLIKIIEFILKERAEGDVAIYNKNLIERLIRRHGYGNSQTTNFALNIVT